MQRLRSIWGLRMLAIVLMTGLLPTVLGPNVRAAQPTSADAYADWLRGYLISPSDPVVARALHAAASSKAQTFDSFLRVFVGTYEAQHPDGTLAEAFSIKAQSTDALVRLLYGQYRQVLGGVPVAHGTISATPSGLSGLTDRFLAIPPATGSDVTAAHRSFSLLSLLADVPIVTPVRVYSAALPQGP